MKTMEKKGFTLIELLIVIAIIGILAVAFLPSLLGAPAKGRDTQRLTSVQKVENFIVSEMLTGVTLPATGCIVDPGAVGSIGELITNNLSSFGGVFPADPQSDNVTTGAITVCTGEFGYIKFGTNTSYSAAVYAAVEEEANANILCSDIKDELADPVLDPGGITVVAPAVGCYLALIQ